MSVSSLSHASASSTPSVSSEPKAKTPAVSIAVSQIASASKALVSSPKSSLTVTPVASPSAAASPIAQVKAVVSQVAKAKQPIISPAQKSEAAVSKALAGIGDKVTVFDLKGLKASPGVTLTLRKFNFELRKIESKCIHLESLRESCAGNKPMLSAISKKHAQLAGSYNTLTDQKIAFVKKNVHPKDQVYALTNQRILPSGVTLYTAQKDITRLLFSSGFSKYNDSSKRRATDYSKGFQSDVNEMGSVGIYFSVGAPTYMNSRKAPYAIKCQTKTPQKGAAVMSISELRARGFTAMQIDQGYKRIQSDFPFIQHEGLPPKNTEIVYLRPQGHMVFSDEILIGSSPDSIDWTGTAKEYHSDILCEASEPPSIHSSWKSMPPIPVPSKVVPAAPPIKSASAITVSA